jgi:hypothetical protein
VGKENLLLFEHVWDQVPLELTEILLCFEQFRVAFAVARVDPVEEILQTIKLLPGEEVVGVNDVLGKRRERLLPPIAPEAGLWRTQGFFESARQIFDRQARISAGVGQGSVAAAAVINAEILEDARRARDSGGQVSYRSCIADIHNSSFGSKVLIGQDHLGNVHAEDEGKSDARRNSGDRLLADLSGLRSARIPRGLKAAAIRRDHAIA